MQATASGAALRRNGAEACLGHLSTFSKTRVGLALRCRKRASSTTVLSDERYAKVYDNDIFSFMITVTVFSAQMHPLQLTLTLCELSRAERSENLGENVCTFLRNASYRWELLTERKSISETLLS